MRKAWLVVTFLLVAVSALSAQTVQGTVKGTVTDQSGAVVPGVSVTLTKEDTNVSQKMSSGADGAYQFSLVPPGKYTVTAEAAHFARYVAREVSVEASKTTPLNIPLSVAATATTVEVISATPLVQTATADLALNVDRKTIEDTPLLSRNIFDLAFLAPQVTQGMNFNPAAGGARESGTGYLLNGAENNDNFSEGGYNITPAMESVAEFTILTNNMNAQYGRAAGAAVSASQKSGTNHFHGVLYEFNRNRSFNSSDFFANRQGSPKPKYVRNQYGVEVDGPVYKDKTFFAFAFDRYTLRQGGQQEVPVPTASELAAIGKGAGPIAQYYLTTYPQLAPSGLCTNQTRDYPSSIGHIACAKIFDPLNTNQNTFYGRIDHSLSAKDRLSFTLNFQRYGQLDLYGGGYASTKPINSTDTEHYHHLALVETHTFGPRAINELTVSHNRHSSVSLNGDGTNTDPHIYVDGVNFGGLGFEFGVNEGGQVVNFTQDRWLFQDNFSYSVGKHSIKIGGGMNWGVFFRNWDLGLPGYYEFGNTTGATAASFGYVNKDGSIGNVNDASDSNFQNDFPYFAELSIDPRTGKKGNAYRHYTSRDLNFFVNDDWKVTRRLTLNLGLRWERFEAPTEVNGQLAQFTNLNCFSPSCIAAARVNPVNRMWNTNNHDFGPRVGFAYDVFGNGKTAVRGGFGISYDRIFDNVWSNGSWNPPFYGLIDWDATGSDNIFYTRPPSPSPSYVPNSLPGAAGRVSVRTMDVNMKDASTQSYYLGVERQVGSSLLFRVNYQGSLGRHLAVLRNLNRYDGMRYNKTFADARPNPLYTGFNYRGQNVSSHYNALILEAQKRLGKGLRFQWSYAWSKLMDYGSDLFSGETGSGSYSQPYYFISNNHLEFERGAGAFDHTHNWKFNFGYDLPFFKSQKGFLGHTLGGWQVNGFYQGYSGHPLEVYAGSNRSRFRGNALDANGIPENLGGDYNLDGVLHDRPNFVGSSISAAYSGHSPADGIFTDNNLIGCGFAGAKSTNVTACNNAFGVVTPNSLFVNPPGTGVRFGTLGRNVFRGPWFNGFDASAFKNIKIREGQVLQIRVEAVNLLNHPNFDGIRTDVTSSQFGKAQILIGNAIARRFQLAARYTF